MRQQVDHHLRRARAAARTQGQGERTSVAEVLDELARTLERIFRDKGVAIDWDADEDLYFLGERQDLLEIAGNAMENACKWGRAQGAGPRRGRRTRAVAAGGRGRRPRPAARTGATRFCAAARGWTRPRRAPASASRSSTSWPAPMAASLTLGDSPLGGLRLEADLPRAEA